MTQGDGDEKGDLIDQNLKRVYDSVLSEEVPDRFARLLAQLQAGETPSDDDGEEDEDVRDDENAEGTQE